MQMTNVLQNRRKTAIDWGWVLLFNILLTITERFDHDPTGSKKVNERLLIGFCSSK